MSGEASGERVSRAAAIKLAALGAAGAAGVMLTDTPAAKATTVDNYFLAENDTSSNQLIGVQSSSGSQGKGYYTGGDFEGIDVGAWGHSVSGNGMYGSSGGDPGSTGAAVFGQAFGNGDAVYGYARGSGAGVHGIGSGGAAVYAEDQSGAVTGNGVLASSDAGTAVRATTQSGTALAVQAFNPGSIALSVAGPAVYSNCGVATVLGTVATPKQAVTFKGAGLVLSTHSVVFATMQANIAGVFVASAVPHVAAGTITINLNQPVAQHVKVGWFVCDLFPAGGPA